MNNNEKMIVLVTIVRHLAEVLDEAMRGKQAIAWAHGFHKGRKTDNGSHISTWPKNPYREEATNGR